jgi:hypothetical protein
MQVLPVISRLVEPIQATVPALVKIAQALGLSVKHDVFNQDRVKIQESGVVKVGIDDEEAFKVCFCLCMSKQKSC